MELAGFPGKVVFQKRSGRDRDHGAERAPHADPYPSRKGFFDTFRGLYRRRCVLSGHPLPRAAINHVSPGHFCRGRPAQGPRQSVAGDRNDFYMPRSTGPLSGKDFGNLL